MAFYSNNSCFGRSSLLGRGGVIPISDLPPKTLLSLGINPSKSIKQPDVTLIENTPISSNQTNENTMINDNKKEDIVQNSEGTAKIETIQPALEEKKKKVGRPKKQESNSTPSDIITNVSEGVPKKKSKLSKKENLSEEKEPLHIRRKNIPKHVKTLVWNKYIGCDKAEAKCISCRQERIENRNFHCGHVIAESNGGDMTINNLRPICAPCNLSMGTKSMNEFTSEFFGWTV